MVESEDDRLSQVRESLPTDLDAVDKQFRAALEAHAGLLDRLDKADLRPGEKTRLRLVRSVEREGLKQTVARRKEAGVREVIQFVEDFIELGPAALLLTGSQRGGDFLNNQLRGRWAEDVVLSIEIEGLVFRRLGPSGAAMPGAEDHRRVVSTFAAIQMLEGKRPDLIAFTLSTWQDISARDKERIATWPERVLGADDLSLVRRAVCGVEVKNSTWHYEKRRQAGGGPLSVTVKEEELIHFRKWSADHGLPIIFVQVLFDRMYCMSFARMDKAITRGYLYEEDDVLRDRRGAGGKTFYHVYATDDRHYCANVAFPDESKAVVALLESGSVVPHVLLLPARATDAKSEVFSREINYRRRTR